MNPFSILSTVAGMLLVQADVRKLYPNRALLKHWLLQILLSHTLTNTAPMKNKQTKPKL